MSSSIGCWWSRLQGEACELRLLWVMLVACGLVRHWVHHHTTHGSCCLTRRLGPAGLLLLTGCRPCCTACCCRHDVPERAADTDALRDRQGGRNVTSRVQSSAQQARSNVLQCWEYADAADCCLRDVHSQGGGPVSHSPMDEHSTGGLHPALAAEGDRATCDMWLFGGRVWTA